MLTRPRDGSFIFCKSLRARLKSSIFSPCVLRTAVYSERYLRLPQLLQLPHRTPHITIHVSTHTIEFHHRTFCTWDYPFLTFHSMKLHHSSWLLVLAFLIVLASSTAVEFSSAFGLSD